MRAREFVMKDAYSFHTTTRAWSRPTRSCTTLTAAFHPPRPAVPRRRGGHRRNRRQRLARVSRARGFRRGRAGVLPDSDYAANVELAEAVGQYVPRRRDAGDAESHHPGTETIGEVAAFFDTSAQKVLKAIAVVTHENEFVLLLLRATTQLNEIKAGKVLGEFRFAATTKSTAT